MAKLPNPLDHRTIEHGVDPIFPGRWSPRAMSGEPISDAELSALFEAARWAPSTYNEQEWRFLYARRGTAHWPTFFGLLMEANQAWCRHAAVLMCIIAHKVFSMHGKPNPVYAFDTGAAFENLALQGGRMGLVVHGMAGFDFEKARVALIVPADYAVMAMVAVGRPGDPDALPAGLREREVPTGRKPIAEIAIEGPFHA